MEYLAEMGVSVVTHRQIADWLLAGNDLPERALAIDLATIASTFLRMRTRSFVNSVSRPPSL